MTHAFFKALLFLGSGSVIHAMAGEQDMRRMGGLKQYLPVTFATMLIGTLAIAGIPPLAGFFSKDEILFRTFLANKVIWVLAVVTALMTAFYMFRLMSMTFLGTYRGPAWEGQHAGHAGAHGDDAHGHGGARARRVARSARVAGRDDVPADGAGRRRDRGRVRRHPGRARRREQRSSSSSSRASRPACRRRPR